ncbi:MAG: DNA methyltransferase [Caldilinea sp.]
MNAVIHDLLPTEITKTTALEGDFPIAQISRIAEQESWRKEINRPLYHIHKWWATRLGSVFRAITLSTLSKPGVDVWRTFYDHHNFADKVVLDPFMGSGTTLGEAIKLGAKAIGCDINPVSTFLVKQAFSRVSEAQLRNTFTHLEKDIAAEIRAYYQTKDPQNGELIPVLYFFWVKTVATPDGEIIPLFSRYVFAQDAYPKKKPKAQIICPKCWNISEDRYDATDLICSHCDYRFDPQDGPASGQYVVDANGKRHRIKGLVTASGQPPTHRLYALLALRPNGEKIYLPASEDDLTLYAQAEARLQSEDLPLPSMEVRPGHNTNQARGYNYLYWNDFFNARQLLCLGLLLRAILMIEDKTVQEQMLCLFSSTLEFNNLFCSYKGEGTGAVRHMFSNHILKPERTPLENSVWGIDKSSGVFSTLFESRLMRAKQYLDQPFEIAFHQDLFGETTDSYKLVSSEPIDVQQVAAWEELQATERSIWIMNGNSARLPLPDCAIDAVITDPPYFDFVHYSELSDFFFAWLAPVLKQRYQWFNQASSLAIGEVQHKDPLVFARQLTAVFSECARVLKDDGVLAFSFHHSRPEGWAAIYEAVTDAGFVIVTAHPVHAELRASSPKSLTTDPISFDAILVCKKQVSCTPGIIDGQAILQHSNDLTEMLETAGISMSLADRFVIVASQTLVEFRGAQVCFEETCRIIAEQWGKLLPQSRETP